jgi:hypothetical protein
MVVDRWTSYNMKTKPKNKFYRNKYLIAMCEAFGLEYVHQVFDNIYEFSAYTGMNYASTLSTLTRLYKGERTHIIHRHQRYEIVFIELTDEEMENYGKKEII